MFHPTISLIHEQIHKIRRKWNEDWLNLQKNYRKMTLTWIRHLPSDFYYVILYISEANVTHVKRATNAHRLWAQVWFEYWLGQPTCTLFSVNTVSYLHTQIDYSDHAKQINTHSVFAHKKPVFLLETQLSAGCRLIKPFICL